LEHLQFIKGCRDCFETVGHIFVHAYYEPDRPLREQRWGGLRWASLPPVPARHCSGKVATRHRERAAYRWSVDTAVYVRQGRQRRGVGRALYTSLLAVLPQQGYVNAYAVGRGGPKLAPAGTNCHIFTPLIIRESAVR
jgi:GNAT superfamily N-acetyltransferase